MRGYVPLFLLAAAATAAPAPHDHHEAPKHSAGTCAPVSTNSTVELRAAVSSLLSNTKATDSFPDALSALLANGAANGTANTVPAESGTPKLYGGSDSSTDASTPDDSTSTDTDATSPEDSTSSDDSTASGGADSSSSSESGQQVPAAASGRLDAIKKAVEKLKGSHEASGGASGDVSGGASGGASGGVSGGVSGGASGDASGDASSVTPGGPSSRHLPSAKDLKEGASVAAHGADAVAAGAEAAGTVEHDVKAASGRSGGEGRGRLDGLRRHHGPFGGIGKRQAASSLEDVVGMDLRKLSEEQLKELDNKNIAERDVAPTNKRGPITVRDAAPTPVDAAHAFNKGDLKNGGDPLIWMVSEQISRVGKREPQTTGWIEEREAKSQTTGWIEERKAEPQTTGWIEEREAVPTQLDTGTLLRARAADAANDWEGPAPTPGGVQVWPEPEFISGIVGRDYVEPTKGPGSITAREAAPQDPRETANLGFHDIPWGNGKREAAPNNLREAAPQDTANLGCWFPGNEKRQAEAEETPVVFHPPGNDRREAAPSGFYTSTLKPRDDTHLDPDTPPTYGEPTPVVKARDDIHLDPRPPPTYGGPGRRAIDVPNDNE